MISWKRVRLVTFKQKKNRNNQKIIPTYFAILNGCTFSALYKYINNYFFFLLNNYMHFKI